MLLGYYLSASEMVPLAPVITGITFGFTFYMHCVCIVRSSHYIILYYIILYYIILYYIILYYIILYYIPKLCYVILL